MLCGAEGDSLMSWGGGHEEVFQADVNEVTLHPARAYPEEVSQFKYCPILGVSEHIVPLV